jgi:hypothetical protein
MRPSEFGNVKPNTDDKERLFVVEATFNPLQTPPTNFLELKGSTVGIHMFDLRQRLKTSSGWRAVWHFPLWKLPSLANEKKLKQHLKLLLENGIPSEKIQELAVRSCASNGKEDVASLFGAEMVASALKAIGQCHGNPSQMTPSALVDAACYYSERHPRLLQYSCLPELV